MLSLPPSQHWKNAIMLFFITKKELKESAKP